MKRCPTCDATYADDDELCAADGTLLRGGRPSEPRISEARTVVSPAASSAPQLDDVLRAEERARVIAPAPAIAGECARCGARDADDGDGYCASCGHRVYARETISIVPPGTAIGGRVVAGARSVDELLVDADGASFTMALGDAALLADEAAATRALDGLFAGRTPRVVDAGTDERRGPFLVLTAPGPAARAVAEAAPQLDVRAALGLARAVLDVVDALEARGMRWTPRPMDCWVDPRGALVLSRVRAAPACGERTRACCAISAACRALASDAGAAGTPRLYRALVGPSCAGPHATRDAAAMRAELDAVDAELARPFVGPRHVAGECDAGLCRAHNEDALAIATGETRGAPWTVMVVCDGVSCSSNAERASTVAAKTACDALAQFARAGEAAREAASGAMTAAIRAAHLAVCSAQIAATRTDEPPGTTIVAGLVYEGRLTVGWVGDSRAYWIGASGAELLTQDHSWAAEVVARGELTEEEALRQPLAHALTRCLGPLEHEGDGPIDVTPDVRARDLSGPGVVVLCSDGLWNYFPDARAVADLVHAAGPHARPREIARRLVNGALLRGGGDNVTVAVLAHGDASPSSPARLIQ